ncbi:S9 family peptidase [Halovivax sp.]|uniref:S9 family peptidase n=1 Tax=Halovivax sp. TaxID=1935978 RepID=UPI0025BA72D2|nr:S9 family peptidase [Halovivax sp.]
MERDVRPYLAARGTRGPTLSPDGRLGFLADVTGTMQAWTMDDAAEWPTQRTFYDERVSFVSWSPAGDRLAFGKDAGADEHDQLFLVDPDEGSIERLTDRPDAIHTWGGWSPDGERIAFAANRRDSGHFDVHVVDVQNGNSRLVRQSEGLRSVVGWSPDGDGLLVTQAHASADQDLYVVDVATGDREHVTPHEGNVRYLHPAFGPEGEAIYCASDANADTLELVRIGLETRAAETVVSGDGWSIDDVALDAGTGRLAYARNVDGYSELYAGRLAGPTEAAIVEVEIPDGVASELTIGPNGERLAATVSSTNLNYSIFALAFDELGAIGDSPDGTAGPEATRWTHPSAGGVPLERYHEPELIRYETFDDREIPAFFTLPDDYVPGETPVIVDVHGGPHSQRRPSWRNRPIRQYFLDRGYALFEPNVRGSSGYGSEYAALDDVEGRMDSVRDVAAGVDWLRDHPAIDADRIVCYGRSYGGFMVLACITGYPDLWAAAIDFVGIANWVTFLENTGEWRRSHREAEYGSLADDREFLESISPIHDVGRIECPLFVQHGENDPRVPVGEARQIAEAVADRGIPVETCIFPDEGHHTTKLENRIEQFERIAAFLDEHV